MRAAAQNMKAPGGDRPDDRVDTTSGGMGSSKSVADRRAALTAETRALIGKMLVAIDSDHSEIATALDSPTSYSKHVLKVFASSDGISVEKFRSSDGLTSVIAVLTKHANCSAAVDAGCKALGNLALYDKATLREMIKAGVIPSIIAAVEHQADKQSEDASVSALKMLCTLTQDEINRKNIFEMRAIQVVVATMAAKEGNARILSHSALLLSNLAFGNKEIKDAVGSSGGLELIAKAMGKHNKHQLMQARGSLALRNLCYNSEPNQKIAGEKGAAEALVGALSEYPNDREVAHQSCVALANISNADEENRSRIVQAGAVTVLIQLMKKYISSATMHDDCISVLRNIAASSTEAQVAIGENGGIECIVHAMRQFPRDEKLSEKAAAALRYACFHAENRLLVLQSGAIEALVGALGAGVASRTMVENSLRAIGNATFGSENAKTTVAKAGGIPTIIKATEMHRLDGSIQEHGCRVLRNLVEKCTDNAKCAAQAGVVNTAVFAMMGFPDNAQVQEQACALLWIMASGTSENLGIVRESEAGRLAEKAVTKHAKHRGVLLQGGRLLDRLNGYEDETEDDDTAGEQPAPQRKKSLFVKFGRKR